MPTSFEKEFVKIDSDNLKEDAQVDNPDLINDAFLKAIHTKTL